MTDKKRITGLIVGYVRGPNTQYPNYVLVHLNLDRDEYVDNYIGRKVKIVDKYGNIYVGKILRRHSRRHPVVEVRFKPNIPGQLIGSIAVIE